jgi:hypothetical protein
VIDELFQSPKRIFFNVFGCSEHSLFHFAGGGMAGVIAANVIARQTPECSPWRFGYKYGRLEQIYVPDHSAHNSQKLVAENQHQFIRGFASPSFPQFC